MYSRVTSIVRTNNRIVPIDIECGIAPGIPIIRYSGNIPARFSNTKDKYSFIFRMLGRKLPNKKIHLHFSTLSEDSVKTEGLDLAIITGIYLALNNTYTEEHIFAYGDVDMTGKITNDGLSAHLVEHSKSTVESRKVVISPDTPKNQVLYNLYPNTKIINPLYINDLLGYFEGTWEGSLSREEQPQADKNNELLSLLLNLNGNTLIVSPEELDLNETSQVPNRHNILLSEILRQSTYNPSRVITARDRKELVALTTIPNIDKEAIIFDHSEKHLEDLNQRAFQLYKKSIYISKPCKCETPNTCICKTIDMHNFRRQLKELLRYIEYVIDFTEPTTQAVINELIEKDPNKKRMTEAMRLFSKSKEKLLRAL